MSKIWSKPGIRGTIIIAGLAVVVISGSFLYGSGAEDEPKGPLVCETDSASATSPLFETQLSDVAIETLGKEPVMLHDLAGEKFTALVFCSYRCPCSDGYTERLQALRETFEPKGVQFVAIHSNLDENIEGMKAYANRQNYPLEIYRDDGAVLADMLKAAVTPEVYVFNGDWVLQYHGRIDDDKGGLFVEDETLKHALDTLLTGNQLVEREKIAMGCAITRVTM